MQDKCLPIVYQFQEQRAGFLAKEEGFYFLSSGCVLGVVLNPSGSAVSKMTQILAFLKLAFQWGEDGRQTSELIAELGGDRGYEEKDRKQVVQGMWGEFGLEVLNGSGSPEEQPPQAEVELLERSLEWEHTLVGMLGVGDLLGDLLGANLADMR